MKAGTASVARRSASRAMSAGEVLERLPRLGPEVRRQMRAGGEQGCAALARELAQAVERGLAHTARGRRHRAPEGHVVVRVHDEAEIGHDVLDLAPLVEAHAPHDHGRGCCARRSASSMTRDCALVR